MEQNSGVQLELRLALLRGVNQGLESWPIVCQLAFDAVDQAAAVRAVSDALGIDDVSAAYVLSMSANHLTRSGRAAVRDEISELETEQRESEE